jgi:hypothetical protein
MEGEDPDSESESRASSPDQHDSKSGNGQRLDDLYPNGSSSALVGPVAARPLPGAGSVRAEPQRGVHESFAALDDDDDDDDAPPPLHEDRLPPYRDSLDDEGIALDDADTEDTEYYDLQPHSILHPISEPTWHFPALNASAVGTNQREDDIDHASNVAADGDDENEDYNSSAGRLNEHLSDGKFMHNDSRWTAAQRRASSPVALATAAAEEVDDDVRDSVEVDMSDASEHDKH